MTLRNIFIWITLICINSPVYSQKNIYQTKQFQFQSTDLVFQRLPEILYERLQPENQIINNPYWPNYIDVYDKVSNDFFTTKPFNESGKNIPAYNNNYEKIYSGARWGFFVGIVGIALGSAFDNKNCDESCNDISDFKGSLIGGLIAYHLATPYGVYKVGNRNNEDGSYAAALLGGIAGHVTGIAALAVAPNIGTGVYWSISAPIGATIGYNISR